jgi:hypothetical protein
VRPAATGGDEAHVWWRQREEMRLTRSGGIGRRRVGLVEYGQGRALRASGVWVGRAPRPHLSARCFQRERDTVEARFWFIRLMEIIWLRSDDYYSILL